MKKIKIVEDKFCRTHGIIKGDFIICPSCESSLEVTIPYTVKRICNSCKEVVEAPPSYFNSVEHRCPCCEIGILQVPSIQGAASNFILDGSWNGKDRSKVIMEKNEQLKRRNAGYEYEQQSIKKKTEEALRNKGIL